ncbi:MAG: glycosyltransferase family 2 protein [Bacteroidales bacterium]|nr:glycosyltransferase family 2 protein [Bacteroidales bacterium]
MVATVVVTYNRLSYLKNLIESLRQQTYTDNHIIVINNSSTDGTAEWLAEQKDLDVVTQGNVGGAGGFFTGMKYAVEKGYDYVWAMDDDVLCRPDALAELMKAMEVRPDAGFVCSRVVGSNGDAQNTPGADDRPAGEKYADTYELVVPHGMVKVKAATFVSILVPSRMIRERGLPLRQFFIWGDDTEFTLRLSAVAPCYIACKSEVTHLRKIQGTIQLATERDPRRLAMLRYSVRNRYVYTRRWGTAGDVLKMFLGDVKNAAKLLFRLKLRQLVPLARGMWETLWFHPRVEKVGENR